MRERERGDHTHHECVRLGAATLLRQLETAGTPGAHPAASGSPAPGINCTPAVTSCRAAPSLMLGSSCFFVPTSQEITRLSLAHLQNVGMN